MGFLPEDGDLCQAISLSGACRMKGRWLPNDDPPGFDQSRSNEMSSTDTTDLLVCGQDQTQPIDQARRIALGDRRQQAGKKSIYVAGASSMEQSISCKRLQCLPPIC